MEIAVEVYDEEDDVLEEILFSFLNSSLKFEKLVKKLLRGGKIKLRIVGSARELTNKATLKISEVQEKNFNNFRKIIIKGKLKTDTRSSEFKIEISVDLDFRIKRF